MPVRPAIIEYKDELIALLLLTGFLILFELSLFLQSYRAFLINFSFASKGFSIPTAIIPDILIFLCTHFALHVLFATVVWLMAVNVLLVIPRARPYRLSLSISLWFLGVATLLIANYLYYPNSRFSLLLSGYLSPGMAENILMMLCAVLLISLLTLMVSLLKACFHYPIITVCLVIVLLANGYLLHEKHARLPAHDAGTATKPNIIIIGVDSLRPDFLSYFGGERKTPFIDGFLQQSSVFSDAVTPLARTFPSWMSILAGIHPKVLGIRSNLARNKQLFNNQFLQVALSKVGYKTMYATDETRFNNIDASYGFDKVISPPIGLNDFILGSINDFPISNLLLNTSIGAKLFPYSFANRPSYFNYDPNSFLRQLDQGIERDRQSPLFFAVHFCLPHHPYIWGSLNRANSTPREWYAQSVLRVDQQLKIFFTILKKAHLLQHSIVILLSDHGETLAFNGDRITEKELFVHRNKQGSIPKFYPQGKQKYSINQVAGHGTDVLGLPQYHSLLAFRLYGTGVQQLGIIPGVVSLMDIKPTVFDLLGLKASLRTAFGKTNGTSLASVIAGKETTVPIRHILIESDFSPQAVLSVFPSQTEVALEGMHIFNIDPKTTRLIVKPAMQQLINQSKQYADIYNHWMLALYPTTQHRRNAILIDLISGEWTNDMSSELAMHAPVGAMKAKLDAFYIDDLYRA